MMEWGITSTVLILAVLMLRRVLRGKLNHRVQYALWLVVLLRLLLPVTFLDSPFGIMNFIPDVENVLKVWEQQGEPADASNNVINIMNNTNNVDNTIKPDRTVGMAENLNSAMEDDLWNQNSSLNPNESQMNANEMNQDTTGLDSTGFKGVNFDAINFDSASQDSGNLPSDTDKKTDVSIASTLLILWLTGAAGMLTAFLVINIRFYLRLKRSRKTIEQDYYDILVYHTDAVLSPCLFGVLRPAIYLNKIALTGKESLYHILAHEYTHYCHRDYIWAVLRMLALCLHWYNPVVWYGAYVSMQDCELACDEGTIRRLGETNRIAYGETLIRMIAVGRHFTNICCAATTMVSSKKSITERIKSIAVRTINSKWALVSMLFVVVLVSACTFTGKDKEKEEYTLNISRSELEEMLIAEGGYGENVSYDLHMADFDADGVDEAFLVVLLKSKEDGERFADIWYYNGVNDLISYKKNELIAIQPERQYILELSDKTFFVYDQLYSTYYKSRVLGIRNGEVVDYFQDPKITEYVDGELYFHEENDVHVHGRKMNAEYDANAGVYYGITYMTGFWYYNKENDTFMEYHAYAKTKDDILSYENGEAILTSIEAEYEEAQNPVYYTYAVRNDFLHIMVEEVVENTKETLAGNYQEQRKYYSYYTYELQGNVIGALKESGKGAYDDLNEESVKAVWEHEIDETNLEYDFLESCKQMYSRSLIKNPVLDIRWDIMEEDTAAFWIYEVHGVGDVRVWTAEIEYERQEQGYWFKEMFEGDGFELDAHNEVDTLEEFKRAYYRYGGREHLGLDDDLLYIPDYFENGMATQIAEQDITAYKKPDEAAVAFYHLTGGKVTKLSEEADEASLTYTFADGSFVDLHMYRTYQGIWLPLEDKEIKNDSYRVNQWFASLKEEDYINAKEIDWEREWYHEELVVLETFPKLDVTIYGNASMGQGIIVECEGNRHLYSKPFLTTRVVVPEFSVYDYDNDGVSEIGMISYIGSGSGYSVEDFAVFDSAYESFDRLYVQNNASCISDIEEHSMNVLATKDSLKIYLNERVTEDEVLVQTILAHVSGLLLIKEQSGVEMYFGDNISYGFGENGEVYCDAMILLKCEESVLPYYLSELYDYDKACADAVRVSVVYDGKGGFGRENYRFSARYSEIDVENTPGIEITTEKIDHKTFVLPSEVAQ